MALMKSIRRSLSPKRDNDQGFSQMRRPARSSMDDSENAVSVEYEMNEMEEVPEGRGSQLKKLKKISKRKPTHTGFNGGLSEGLSGDASEDSSFQECFRISIDEDSTYEDDKVPSRSSRWQGRTSTLKPPSMDHLDVLLGNSYSESEDEMLMKRRSTIRTQIDQSLCGLDDSTHPIPSLAPPSLSDLSTLESLSTAATMQTSESSVQNGILRKTSSYDRLPVTKAGGSFLKEGKSINDHDGSGRTSLGLHSSLDLTEASMTSRASTIRSKIEASLDASSHEMHTISPQHHKLQTGSHRNRQQPLLQGTTSATARTSLQKERKSRSPGPISKLRDKPCKSPARTRSGKSSVAMLHQITPCEVATLNPKSRGNRKSIEKNNALPGDSKRKQRFTIRRTVSSPATSRKMISKPAERTTRVRQKSRSSRGSRTLSVGTMGERKESLTSRARRTLSIDSGEESLKLPGKSPRNLSVDSDPYDKSLKGAPDNQSRTQKKNIARKKSKSPKRKKSSKVDRADDDDDDDKSNKIESNPYTGKSRSLSPPILAKKKKGTKGECSSRKDSERSRNPTRPSTATKNL